MPQVTDIKQQQRRTDRYSIYFDGKYLLSLSESELLASGISIGKQYNATELEELKGAAELDKAYGRALDYLARRQRSQWEMADYLRRKGYDSPIAQTILNKLSKRGYLDDEAFARAWVDNRRLLKPTSLRRLKQELQQKHVAREIVDRVLNIDEQAPQHEHDALLAVMQKKLQLSRYQEDANKLTAYLLRQGFRYDDIKQIYKELDGEDLVV